MGIATLRVASVFRAVVTGALPADHRIVAVREMLNGDVDFLVRGPMLPDGDELQPPPVNLLVDQMDAGEGTTYWASWSHAPHSRWQIRDPWSRVGLGLE